MWEISCWCITIFFFHQLCVIIAFTAISPCKRRMDCFLSMVTWFFLVKQLFWAECHHRSSGIRIITNHVGGGVWRDTVHMWDCDIVSLTVANCFSINRYLVVRKSNIVTSSVWTNTRCHSAKNRRNSQVIRTNVLTREYSLMTWEKLQGFETVTSSYESLYMECGSSSRICYVFISCLSVPTTIQIKTKNSRRGSLQLMIV